MLILNFLYAAALLVLGATGLALAEGPAEIRTLATPGLFFGGAGLLCAFFALREPHHGLAGATFLAFLAFLTTAAKLFGLLSKGQFDWSRPEPRLATALLGIAALYLIAAIRTWRRNRRKRPPGGP